MKLLKVKELEAILNNIPETVGEKHLDIRQQLNDYIFMLKDGGLGVMYKIEGVYDEPLNIDQLQSYLNIIKSSIEETIASFDVVAQLHFKQREINKRPGDPFLFSDTSIGKILKNEDESFFKSGMIQREFFLCLRFRFTENKSIINSILSKIVTPNPSMDVISDEAEKIKNKTEKINRYLNALEGQLSTGFRFQRVGSEKYISTVQNILNGGISQSVYPETEEIHTRIQSPPISLNEKKDGLIINGKELAIFYFSIFPKESSTGRMRHFLDEIPFKNIDFVWTISSGSQDYNHAFIESFFRPKVAAYKEIQDDLASYKSKLGPRNPEVTMSLRLIIHNYDESQIGKIYASANTNLWGRMKKENQIPFFMFISSLPLNCVAESNKIIGRYKTLLLSHAVKYIHIFNGPPNKEGVITRVSRYGTPTKFNAYKGEGNRIGATIGVSRAGKSSLTNDDIMEFSELYKNSIIRNIDIKTSYEKVCDLLGGKVIRFSEDELRTQNYSPFSISPEFDDDDVNTVFLLIKSVILMKNPGLEFNSLHDELLSDSIKHAYNNNKLSRGHDPVNTPPHPIWSDVLSSLPISSQNYEDAGVSGAKAAADDISSWSVNLYESGQYGFLFNRHEKNNDVEFAEKKIDKIIVYDLDGIQDETLRYIAAFLAFIRTSRDFKKLPLKTPKLFNIDEFGIFCIGNDKAQEVSEQQIQIMFKTCAKLNVCMNTITNNIEDYTKTKAGKTVWGQATIKRFLPLGDMFSAAKEAWGNDFSEGEWQIIRSLEKEPQHHRSAVYIVSKNDASPYRGSYYNILTPLRDAIVTSSATPIEYYRKRKKENQEKYSEFDFRPEEILKEMATNMPYGLEKV